MSNTNSVADALKHASNMLDSVDPSPFSPPGFLTLRASIVGYIADLIAEARKVAKRHSADTVSAAHVEIAANYLVTSSARKIHRHLGTIGGILLGAALSTIFSMVADNKFNTLGTLVSVGAVIVGVFLVAFHIGRE